MNEDRAGIDASRSLEAQDARISAREHLSHIPVVACRIEPIEPISYI
jgi:hypothetical protein